MRKLFVALLLCSVVFNFFSCKASSPMAVDTRHNYQIKYVRRYPVVSPEEPEMDQGRAQLVLRPGEGGDSSSLFSPLGENEWVATFFNVPDDLYVRHVFVIDLRILKLQLGGTVPSVARDIYMKGDTDSGWTQLNEIEASGLQDGEWASVILQGGTVRNP